MRTIKLLDVQSESVVATIRWTGTDVVVETENEMLRENLNEVVSIDRENTLSPKDGEAYLDAILASYSGAYMQAVEE